MQRRHSSGLKSAVARVLQGDASILSSEPRRRAFAHAFQQAAFAQIQDKVQMALTDDHLDLPYDRHAIKDIVISGGVASNQYLRRCINDTLRAINRIDVQMHFPPISLCTDNAAMIAHAGLISWDLTRDLGMKPRAKWSLEELAGN